MVDVLAQTIGGGVSGARVAFVSVGALLAAVIVTASKSGDAPVHWPGGSPVRELAKGCASALVALGAWVIFWGALFPYVSMNDTVSIMHSPLRVSNQHPLAYGVFLRALGIGGDEASYLPGVIAYVGVQMFLWFATLACALAYARWWGSPRWVRLVVVAWWALNPIVANYTFAVVKDALWGPFAVLLSLACHYVYVCSRAGEAHRLRFAFWLPTGAILIGFMVLRNNALAVALVAALILAWWGRSRWKIACPVLAVALAIGFVPGKISEHYLGPHKSVEAMAVPLQTTAYALKVEPSCIGPQYRSVLNRILPIEQWAALYYPTNVDAIKYNAQFRSELADQHAGELMAGWRIAAEKCPTVIAEGFGRHTQDGWRIDSTLLGNDDQSFFTAPVSNACGSETCQRDLAAPLIDRGLSPQPWWPTGFSSELTSAGRAVASSPLGKIGPWMWALVLLGVGFAARRRTGEALALFGVAALIWGSLLVAAPTFHPLRYFQFVVPLSAVALAILTGGRAGKAREDA